MRPTATGAVLAAVFVAATGAASAQEAMPSFMDIAAAGGPGAVAGAPPVFEEEPVALPSYRGAGLNPDASPAPEKTPVQAASGGSRLLRMLEERTGAGPGDEHAPGASPPGTLPGPSSLLTVEGCPRALLRRLLAGAAGEADALAALAIETEILTLCSERQRIVTALFETEARLRELRAPAEPPTAVEAARAAAPPPPALPAEPSRKPVEHAPDPVPSPLRQALAAAPESGPKPGPSLGWFSIVGSAGALRAGITDGTGAWFVREGDALPDGGTVAAIAARPPSVRTTAPGEEKGEPLPFRPRPGGIR